MCVYIYMHTHIKIWWWWWGICIYIYTRIYLSIYMTCMSKYVHLLNFVIVIYTIFIYILDIQTITSWHAHNNIYTTMYIYICLISYSTCQSSHQWIFIYWTWHQGLIPKTNRKASKILVVAHSYGAPNLVNLLKVEASSRERLAAVAFTVAGLG